MERLDFKNTSCFDSGQKFGHLFAETEILPKPLFLAEIRRNRNRIFGRTLKTIQYFEIRQMYLRYKNNPKYKCCKKKIIKGIFYSIENNRNVCGNNTDGISL